MPAMAHPDLPGRIVEVAESVAQHLRRSRWHDAGEQPTESVSLVKPDEADETAAPPQSEDAAPTSSKPKTARAAGDNRKET